MSVYKEPIIWIRQSIDSILTQSFRDFEFIIVNDFPGKEDVALLLEEYRQNDSRVIIIPNETNLGLTKSLNRALLVAKGKYIARMDADDISVSNRFEKQIVFLEHHSEISAVGSWVMQIDEDGNLRGEIVKYETSPQWVRAWTLQNSQVCHPVSVFRREILGFPVRYDESVRFAQDYSLWVTILSHGEIANLPEVLLYWRQSSQQITSNRKQEQWECAERVQKKAFALFDIPVTDSFLKVFSSLTIRHQKDLNKEDVKNEFCSFFDNTARTEQNSLALEIIYSTYLTFIKANGGRIMHFITEVIKNSSLNMLMIGCRFGGHLIERKVLRR